MPAPTRGDQIVLAQTGQLLPQGRLAQPEDRLELAHREFLITDQAQVHQPVRVGERLQEVAGLSRPLLEVVQSSAPTVATPAGQGWIAGGRAASPHQSESVLDGGRE